ncbi:MAG: thioredoxin domain-containing protein [Gammaproteobacteria bacterium]
MFRHPATQTENTKAMIEKLLSKLQVTVSSQSGSTKTGLDEIFAKAKAANKSVIYTFTPGPFKSKEEMPKGWMETELAVGCTAQLTAFEKSYAKLNAIVFAVNKHSSSYQCGSGGLLATKKFNNLFMISDENGELEKALDLETITLEGKDYLKRFTVAIRPDGEFKLFGLSSPVNDEKAAEHIKAITQFLSPHLEEKDEQSQMHSIRSTQN